MTFPKHIWGGGVTLQMGLVIKRNVHSNPRASRTDGFHRGVLLWARYCTSHILYSYTYVRYLYLHIFLIIYIYIAFSPWITHRNTGLYQQKSTKTWRRWCVASNAGFSGFHSVRCFAAILASAAHQRGGHHPGFSSEKPRDSLEMFWRFVGGSGKWFPSRWVSGRNFGNLTWNHDYWSKGIYMYNHVHKYLCIYMCIYFYSIFIHLYMFIYIYICIHVDSTYMHACIHTHAYMHTCINAYMHSSMHPCIHPYIHTDRQTYINTRN